MYFLEQKKKIEQLFKRVSIDNSDSYHISLSERISIIYFVFDYSLATLLTLMTGRTTMIVRQLVERVFSLLTPVFMSKILFTNAMSRLKISKHDFHFFLNTRHATAQFVIFYHRTHSEVVSTAIDGRFL